MTTRGSYSSIVCPYEGGEWKGKPPKNDDGYFEEMTRTIFQAGLNWEVIRNKWSNFQKAFVGFSSEKVAAFDEKDAKKLTRDEGIVRNNMKIRSTIYNAQEFVKIKKEHGSFPRYVKSFDGENERLLSDLRTRFRHLGDSSSRIFLLSVGVKVPLSARK